MRIFEKNSIREQESSHFEKHDTYTLQFNIMHVYIGIMSHNIIIVIRRENPVRLFGIDRST